jgi:hypothetical protein
VDNFGVPVVFIIYILSSLLSALAKQAKKRAEYEAREIKAGDQRTINYPSFEPEDLPEVIMESDSESEAQRAEYTEVVTVNEPILAESSVDIHPPVAVETQWEWSSTNTMEGEEYKEEPMMSKVPFEYSSTPLELQRLSKDDIRMGLILAEVLGPPRAIKMYRPKGVV